MRHRGVPAKYRAPLYKTVGIPAAHYDALREQVSRLHRRGFTGLTLSGVLQIALDQLTDDEIAQKVTKPAGPEAP